MGNGVSKKKTAGAAQLTEQPEGGEPQPPDGVGEQSDKALKVTVPALIDAAQTLARNSGDTRQLGAHLEPTAPLSVHGSAAAEPTESCAPEIDASLSDAGRQREASESLEQADCPRGRQRLEACCSTPAVGTLHNMLAQEDAEFFPVERQLCKPSGTSDPPGASHQIDDDTAFLVLESFEYAGHCRQGTRVQERDHDAATADSSSNLDGEKGQRGASKQAHADTKKRASVHAADPDDEMLEQEIKFYRAKVRGFSQTLPLARNPCTPISDSWSRTRYTQEKGGDNLLESLESLPWGLGHVRYGREHAASQEIYLGSWARGLPNGISSSLKARRLGACTHAHARARPMHHLQVTCMCVCVCVFFCLCLCVCVRASVCVCGGVVSIVQDLAPIHTEGWEVKIQRLRAAFATAFETASALKSHASSSSPHHTCRVREGQMVARAVMTAADLQQALSMGELCCL